MMALSEGDKKRLRRFQARVQELRERNFYNGDCAVLKMKVDFNSENGLVESTFKGFNDDAFRAAIQLLRQFTLDREEVHFYSICNIVYRQCDRPELVGWNKIIRKDWQETLKRKAPVHFSVGEKQYCLDDCLSLLFYGCMSHTLPKRADEWDSLSSLAQHNIYFKVQHEMPRLFTCLNNMDSVIMYWLDDPQAPIPDLPNR